MDKIKEGESQKREDAGVWKGRKVAIHCVFPMIWGSGGLKSNLTKAAGAEPAGQMRDEKLHAVVARSTFVSKKGKSTSRSDHFGSWDVEKVHAVVVRSTFPSQDAQKQSKTHQPLTTFGSWDVEKVQPLWREAHFQVKMHKTHQHLTTFGSWDIEKVHAVVARSTFPSQDAQNTPTSDHFWKLRDRKSARRCGAKHMSKTKCTKHTNLGPLLEVETSKKCSRCGAKHMSKTKCTKHTNLGPLLEVETSKKCTPLWCEAHFQVKMHKNNQKHTNLWPLLEVEISKKCTPLWREAHFQVKMHKTHQPLTTFGSWDIEKVHAVVARSSFPSSKRKKCWFFAFFDVQMSKK